MILVIFSNGIALLIWAALADGSTVMGLRVRWIGIGLSMGAAIGAVLGASDRYERLVAELTTDLALSEAQVAGLMLSSTLRDDQIRGLTAALDEAKGSNMVAKLAGLTAIIAAAHRAIEDQWAALEGLYDLDDRLQTNSELPEPPSKPQSPPNS